MASLPVRTSEPLTLFTSPDLGRIYDRVAMLDDLAHGRLPRQRADRFIAKVLPAGSELVVEPHDDRLCHVVDCAYRPFYRKELYALAELLTPIEHNAVPRHHDPPPDEQVLAALRAQVGTPYLFGGSAPRGSEAQANALVRAGLFEIDDLGSTQLLQIARSAGIDCSGLFNLATQYSFFGDSKDVYQRFAHGLVPLPESATAQQVAAVLEPLDIVIFRGHMLIALGDGNVIQAVGDGRNAETFSQATGHPGPPFEKYNRVVIDEAEPILTALLELQGRRCSPDWHLDDEHVMVVRYRIAKR